MPSLPRRDSGVIPEIQGSSADERTEMDVQALEPRSVLVAIAYEDVPINYTHRLLVVQPA
jgi:hypothetical protein